MEQCDVLIVGGGPAGSACAWKLRQHGIDVVVIDRAVFPREKVCAGWITPPILHALHLDPHDYAHGRVFQPFTSFAAGLMGERPLRTEYDRPVSFGIRRCEFDDYLLQRSGARRELGVPVKTMRPDADRWIVNDRWSARVLIGAGGHFCPVSRLLVERSEPENAPVILAQEVEFPLPLDQRANFPVAGDCPEFFFCPDLAGYGWIVRKGDYLNIGLGREHERHLSAHLNAFLEELRRRNKLPNHIPEAFHGHAYRLHKGKAEIRVPPGVLLIGDALGLAYPESGEGIRPAIESGLIAADYIGQLRGDFQRLSFSEFLKRCHARFGPPRRNDGWKRHLPRSLWTSAARWALRSRWFQRRILLDRWFLHRHQAPL